MIFHNEKYINRFFKAGQFQKVFSIFVEKRSKILSVLGNIIFKPIKIAILKSQNKPLA